MTKATQEKALALSKLRADVRNGRAKELRERAKLSQSEVAHSIGASRAAVSLWETGRRMPRGEPALRYAQLLAALACSIEMEVA